MNQSEKKIALVANTSWSIYNFRLDVARHLQSLGYLIYVISPRDKHSEKLIAEGFHFIDAPIKSYSTNPFYDLEYLFFLLQVYRQHSFTHAFHYTIKANIYGSIAAKVLGITSTAVITGLGRLLKVKGLFKKQLIWSLYRLGCGATTQVWFLNNEDYKYFLKKRISIPSKSRVIPSEGVNLKKYYLKRPKDWSQKRFLFAGRLLVDKGVDIYLEAAKKVQQYYPDAIFDIVGFIDSKDSNSISPTKILKYQSQGVISYHGDTEDITPFIQNASCVVLPSVYGEGVSRILLEAGAMSTPMITTANRGCTDVVTDGFNGFICKTPTVDALVDQLLAFITLDAEAKEVMGQNGHLLVSQKYNITQIIDIYKKTINPSISTLETKASPHLN